MTGENGILLLDKERGITSAKAIAQIKHKLSLSKIGHAGTLDPMATGLLVCMIGKATKLASRFEGGAKIYSGVFLFGRTTDSDDVTGRTLSESDARPALEFVNSVRNRFIGTIEQLPPAVSAIKIGGVRAYEIARRGEAPQLKPRPVTIFSFESELRSPSELWFRIRCSKGTYIRSIARDMGEILGCGACLQELRREGSEPFSISQAKKVSEIGIQDIMPPEAVLEDICHH